MWDFDINPVIFSIGTFEVRWYGVMIVVAVIAGIAISLVEAKRKGLKQDTIWDLALWVVIGGILGSRLLHIIDRWDYYYYHPEQLFNFAGLAIWGAVLGGLLAVMIYCLVKRTSFWQLGDTIAPGAIMGQAIGRVGCLLNGCCYGLTCEQPFGIVYHNPESYAPQGIPLYPTQIFHIIWNLIGFGILWALRKKLKPDGALFLVWLIFFGVGDFVIRYFRESEPFLFNLPEAQVVDILIVVIALIILILKYVRYKPVQPAVQSEEANKNGQNQEG